MSQFLCPQYYIHATGSKTCIMDESPTRSSVFRGAPLPETVGPFYTEGAAKTWVLDRMNSKREFMSILVVKSE